MHGQANAITLSCADQGIFPNVYIYYFLRFCFLGGGVEWVVVTGIILFAEGKDAFIQISKLHGQIGISLALPCCHHPLRI